jgi:C-terminal processing protease CtpA/Prc
MALLWKSIVGRTWLLGLLCLSACGGGSSTSPAVQDIVPTTTAPSAKYVAAAKLANKCATPDASASPAQTQGSVEDEKSWVRSYVDEKYLWYQDVPTIDAAQYTSAALYFDDLKTPAKNSAGTALDRFHWSETKAVYDQWSTGVGVDYGIEWAIAASSPPRDFVVANVEPLSPAFGKFLRGDKIMSIDGVDFINGTDKTALNNGLSPSDATAHTFVVQRAGQNLTLTISAGKFDTTPVRYQKVITDNGVKFGYLYYDSMIAKSQQGLIDAFSYFRDQGATELVLDLRYNGGGLLSISSQLAFMIAGRTATAGKIFNRLVYNDKRSSENYTYDFLGYALNSNFYLDYTRPLPTLNLSRVTLLVDKGTASASEAVINGLRGINVTVTLIGATTYGKPYGFTPQPNCGRYYYAVEFKGQNHQAFSDFDAGFAPTCSVADDLAHPLGDPAEARLAEALQYRRTGRCSANPSAVASIKAMGLPARSAYVVQPQAHRLLMIPDAALH